MGKTQSELAKTKTIQQWKQFWQEEYYEKGQTHQQIADKLGCSKTVLRSLLKKLDITKGQGRPVREVKFKDEVGEQE